MAQYTAVWISALRILYVFDSSVISPSWSWIASTAWTLV
ncbi:hypothetical protein SVIOM74S_03434 [Streptomyces violarus]